MNVGVIGCGRVVDGHMIAYRSIEGVKVVAVSDVVADRARALAEKYKIDKAFTDYRDLLGVKDLDLVDICTPTLTHAEIACDVAKSGRDFLLEKPMARTSVECERIIQEAKRNGVRGCVVHNQLFCYSIRIARQLVDSGQYDIASFRTCTKENEHLIGAPPWVTKPESGGVLWEVGCHAAYLQLHFLKDLKNVYAIGTKTKYPVYDNFAAILQTSSETFGIIEISFLAKEPESICEINTSDGRIAIMNLEFDHFLERSEEPPAGAIGEIASKFYRDTRRVLEREIKFGMNLVVGRQSFAFHSHIDLIKAYVDSLRDDGPQPVSLEEGKNAIRLLECIEESLKGHEVVSIDSA